MATTMEAVAAARPRPLEYLPVSFFGSIMGLTGLSIAWKFAHAIFDLPLLVSDVIAIIAVLAFTALLIAYGIKAIAAPDKVLAEFRHPIAGNLFGTFLISVLLLPIVIAPVSLALARVLWTVGAVGMVLFAWTIVSRWMSDRQQTTHATPAWIVPVVGMLDVPLAIPSLQLPPMPEVMLLSLAVGLFFALPIFTLVFSRLVFEAPMPDAMQPTLLILLAPFAVGFASYVVTVGHIDLFAEALYFLTFATGCGPQRSLIEVLARACAAVVSDRYLFRDLHAVAFAHRSWSASSRRYPAPCVASRRSGPTEAAPRCPPLHARFGRRRLRCARNAHGTG